VELRFYTSINSVDKQLWQFLPNNDYPFIKFSFLSALENAGDKSPRAHTGLVDTFVACNHETGWRPCHAVVSEGGRPLAFLPNYIKDHSYGEYIFDWAWANAYQQNGLDYYPKLLNAIPFSPVSGPRLLIAPDTNEELVYQTLTEQIKIECDRKKFSSFHSLYLSEQASRSLSSNGFVQRHSFQYHWLNQKPGSGELYLDFPDFLQQLKSRKRKSVARERQTVTDAGIEFSWLEGAQIEDSHWEVFYRFYQLTYAKRSGHGGYLPKAFFKAIGDSIPENVVLLLALKDSACIAGALYLKSNDTLYGRYWGCTEEASFLHFEACIYQGIEYCIRHGLKKFDAGAQGEHKLQRGFYPVSTWSNHWIQHAQFRSAIARFIEEEKRQNLAYMRRAEEYLPYKQLSTP